MQQADHAVTGRHLFHDFHGELIVIGGNIIGGKNGGQLMLSRGGLIVLGFGQHAQFPKLLIQIGHVRGHPGFDDPKVMIFQFLPLGRRIAQKRAAGELKIRAFVIDRFID